MIGRREPDGSTYMDVPAPLVSAEFRIHPEPFWLSVANYVLFLR